MKFKKLLATTCSFLLAATSFLSGGSTRAKNLVGGNFFVFMINSGEGLGNGHLDGDKDDQDFFCDTLKFVSDNKYREGDDDLECVGWSNVFYNRTNRSEYVATYVNEHCSCVKKAMESITGFFCSPDVFIVAANLAKSPSKVEEDVAKHVNNILSFKENCDLFNFNKCRDPRYCERIKLDPNVQKVDLITVPIVIYGVVPEHKNQLTSNEDLVDIVKKTRNIKMGDAKDQLKYIHNEINIRENNTSVCINIDDNSQRNIDIKTLVEEVASNPNVKPQTIGPLLNEEEYRNYEAERQRDEAERQQREQEERQQREQEERQQREAETKEPKTGCDQNKGLIIGGGAITLMVLGSGIKLIVDEVANKKKPKKDKVKKIRRQNAQTAPAV